MTDLDLWTNLPAVKAGKVQPIMFGAPSPGTAVRLETAPTPLAGA